MSQCLGIIGCGNMANAIVKGLSADKAGFQDILVNDLAEEKALTFSREYRVKAVDYETMWKECNTIILAVKPHQVGEVLNLRTGGWHPGQLIISIAAGIKLASMEEATDNLLPIIRVMPNTPCLIGQGITAVAAGSKTTAADVDIAMRIFNRLGTAIKIDEKYMDAVTAVSGSGPAYVFLVVESFINAALQIGLDINMAQELVIKTMKGSLEMLEQSGEHPAVLRQDVSSPGGTTIAGIRKLEDNGIRKAFFDAVEMAYNRSIELSSDD